MRIDSLIPGVVCLALLPASAAFANSADCRWVAGETETRIMPGNPDIQIGIVTGDLAGYLVGRIKDQSLFPTVILQHVIQLSTGGVIHTDDDTAVLTLGNAFDRIDQKVNIVGGTGPFRFATGAIRAKGIFDKQSQTYNFSYQGKLCANLQQPPG